MPDLTRAQIERLANPLWVSGSPISQKHLDLRHQAITQLLRQLDAAETRADAAAEQMRERCIAAMAVEMRYRCQLRQQQAVASMFPMLRDLPLHEEN